MEQLAIRLSPQAGKSLVIAVLDALSRRCSLAALFSFSRQIGIGKCEF
jgi:hypothetical protein